MKRSISMLLLIAMLAGMTACGESGGGNTVTETTSGDTTTAEPVETGIPEPELPVKDYGGATFTFLMRGRTAPSYMQKYIFAEEMNGEVVNDAIFDRNRAVEEKFNIKIEIVENNNNGEINDARTYILAGDPGVDVISAQRFQLGTLAAEGYLVDFNGIPNIDMTAPYWDQNAIEQLSVADRLYLMANDITVNNLAGARFIFYNKRLVEEYKLPNPYEAVQNNTWTLNTFFNMISAVSSDLNGDAVFDHNDLYGMLTEDGSSNGTVVHLLAGSGVRFTTNNKDGVPELSINNEKTQDIISRVFSAIQENDNAISYVELKKTADTSAFANEYNYGRSLFANGQFLFVQNGANVVTAFVDMEDDYGIAPNPKYDAAQENYHHKVDKYALIFGVPVSMGDIDRVGAVMEYMAWLSNKTVVPAYFDVTLQAKRLRDATDYEMLELVKASTYYELADTFNLGVDSIVWSAYEGGGSLASAYAASSASVEAKLADLIETFSSLE